MFFAITILTAVFINIITADQITKFVCEYETLSLDCPSGYSINILTAMYGKLDAYKCYTPGDKAHNCAVGNAFNIMQQNCNGREVCNVAASNDVFGDPCYGSWKYLEVSYECTPVQMTTKRACERRNLDIYCPHGQQIRIMNAMYGRNNPYYCLDASVYHNNCNSNSALSVVQSRCDNMQACTVEASNALFGDPCPGSQKYLEVDYQCQ